MFQVSLDPDAWEESKRLGPSTVSVVRRWTAAASKFHPIRRLHAPFDKFAKENKPLYDFVFASLGLSLAAAHASSHAAAFIEEFVRKLSTILEGPFWSQFCADVKHAFNADVIFPLRNSTHCMAGSVGKAITAIRSGVIKNVGEAVQPVLRSSPPADGFFFGDPSSQVRNSLNFAMMSSLVTHPKITPTKPFTKQPGRCRASGCCRASGRCRALSSFHGYEKKMARPLLQGEGR